MRRLGLPEVRISASKIRHNFAYLQTLGLFFVNGKGRTGGCGAAGALRGRWNPAAGRFSGAGEAGGLGRAMRFRSSWRGFRAARVRLCCEGRNGCRGPERCGMGCGARRFSDVRRVRLKGPEVPSGRRFPESATWKNRCGVGGSCGGFGRAGRTACGCWFCEVCGAFGRLSLRKTPAKAGGEGCRMRVADRRAGIGAG